MSLFCETDGDHDGADWWWYQPAEEAPLATKRSRKCCSCGAKVRVGDTARKVRRYRPATEWEEMRGLGDEVQLADWYLCETCGDLADSISELGFCYNLGGESLKDQIAEYRETEAAEREWQKTHNAKVSGGGGELAPDVAPEELRQEKQVGGPVNCSDSELCTFLLALEAGFLPTYYSDTNQSVQLKSMSIASKSYRRGKQTVLFHGFPSLRMSQNLMDDHGAELLTSWLAAFRVKTSALPETAQDLTESIVECGTTWPASLAKFDPDTSSWKTAQLLLLGGLEEFSETWPRWGLMRAGECWERQTLMPRTSESASGLWPTVTVCGNYNRKGASATSGDGLATAVTQRTYPTATATAYKGWSPKHNLASTDDRLDYTVEREAFNPGQQTPPMRLNPAWVEWFMGWPIGHTELKPLVTDKFQEWQRQHSPSWPNN